jgi:hypothetical protein
MPQGREEIPGQVQLPPQLPVLGLQPPDLVLPLLVRQPSILPSRSCLAPLPPHPRPELVLDRPVRELRHHPAQGVAEPLLVVRDALLVALPVLRGQLDPASSTRLAQPSAACVISCVAISVVIRPRHRLISPQQPVFRRGRPGRMRYWSRPWQLPTQPSCDLR